MDRQGLRPFLLCLLLAAVCPFAQAAERDLPLNRLKLPAGFSASVYARVDDARSLALSPSGIVYVGNRSGDSVYAILPPRNGAKAEVVTVASGLNTPNGVAFKDGDLFVAEISRILKFPNVEKNLTATRPVVIVDDYPTDRGHGWKFIAFGPDGKLYVPVGAPCNICDAGDPYASLTRINSDGTGREIFARGIRNTVGFTWHPTTKELWFTDNGRDMMGDDMPDDELNHAPVAGLHFGYPFFHAAGIPDPKFGQGKRRGDYVEPVQAMGPHVAALGVRFYTGTMFPPNYRGRAFIAQRGSWNRSQKIGYRVMMVTLEGNKAVGFEEFAGGWLTDGEVWGRPVDVLVMPDGALLVSDDFSGTVYRITYDAPDGGR